MAVFDPQQLAALQARMQATQNLAPPPGPPPPNMPGPSGMQQVAAMPPPPQPNVEPPMATVEVPQPKPGPIKSLLTNLLYGGGQAMLQHVGLPTDYEKQQNALKIQLAQQQQQSLEQYRQAEGNRMEAQTAATTQGIEPFTIPNQPIFGSFAGQTLPKNAAVAVMQKMAGLASAQDIAANKNTSAEAIAAGKNATAIAGKQIQFGPTSYLRRSVKSIGGRIISFDKGDPDNKALQKDLGPDTALITGPRNAESRAYAQAKYGGIDSTDESGSPTYISRLQALQQGAPHVGYTNAKGVLSDMVGVKQYQDILDNKITPNLGVLEDPAQRAAIAHTLSESDKNPGMLQALITSGVQEGALSPQGAALAAGIMQGREFGGVARKYGGNMNGTEGLMQRIMANQASPLHAKDLNESLIRNDREFTDKALSSILTLQKNSQGVKSRNPVPSPTSAPASTSTGHPSFFHPLK